MSRVSPSSSRIVLVPVLFLLAIYAIKLRFYLHYFPYGDDPVLLQASAGSAAHWFTEGFSRYFLVYPGWSTSGTDFVRPGVNLIVRAEEILCGQHYALYFAAYFLAQMFLCVACLRIARLFGVPERWQLAAGCLVAIQPAFLNVGLISIASAFDLWCGLFAILSLYFILREHYALALAALTLAVFTKEPALYAPLAAALTVVCRSRRRALAASMLLPLAAWFVVRKLFFLGSGGGIYAFPSHRPLFLLEGLVKGLVQWPIGMVDSGRLIRNILVHAPLASPVDLVLLASDALLWVFLIVSAYALLKNLRASAGLASRSFSPLILLLWLLGALSFGVLTVSDTRFGGSVYPLEILFAVVMLQHAAGQMQRRLTEISVAMLAFAFLWYGGTTLWLQREPMLGQEHMHKLIDGLRQNAQASTIYVLHAPEGYSRPESIAAFAGIPAKIIILDQVHGCIQSSAGRTVLTATPQALSLTSTFPDCAEIAFNSVPPEVFANALPGLVIRPRVGTYALPEGRVAHRSMRGAATFLPYFGRQLNIQMPALATGSIVLWYDWASASFRCAGALCRNPS